MADENILLLNNEIYSNNNNALLSIINQLQNIINDINKKNQMNNIISQLKNIIMVINKVISDNKKSLEQIRMDIKRYHNDMSNKMKNLENIIKNNNVANINNNMLKNNNNMANINNNMIMNNNNMANINNNMIMNNNNLVNINNNMPINNNMFMNNNILMTNNINNNFQNLNFINQKASNFNNLSNNEKILNKDYNLIMENEANKIFKLNIIDYKSFPFKRFPNLLLKNNDNSFYFSSIFQCLLHIPELFNYFFHQYYEDRKSLKININSKTKGLLSEQFYEIIKFISFINSDNDKYNSVNDYSLNPFISIISKANKKFEKIEENELKDLLIFIIEEMDNELNYYRNKSQISSNSINNFHKMNLDFDFSIFSYLFYGITKHSTICSCCNKTFLNFEYFKILDFPLINFQNKNFNLYQGFKDFFKSKFFKGKNGFYCPNCKTIRDGKSQSWIYCVPLYLLINLDYGKNKKNKPKKIDFEGVITIMDFVDSDSKKKSEYKLISVCSFLNDSNKYEVICNDINNQIWYRFNDIGCSESSFEELHSNCPCLLLYKRLK